MTKCDKETTIIIRYSPNKSPYSWYETSLSNDNDNNTNMERDRNTKGSNKNVTSTRLSKKKQREVQPETTVRIKYRTQNTSIWQILSETNNYNKPY